MEPKIAAGARQLDPGPTKVTASAPPAKAEKPPVVTGPDPADLRLIIEEDQASGSYVYKTINRATGEVVQQFPRDDLLKLHAERQYTAGSVIRTKA
jgi:flagellar protein FlaG